MILRKRRTRRELPIEDSDESGEGRPVYQFVDRAPNPEDRCVQRERAVEICQLQERSLKETAHMLGISVMAAKGRLFHAKVALRRAPGVISMAKERVRRAA